MKSFLEGRQMAHRDGTSEDRGSSQLPNFGGPLPHSPAASAPPTAGGHNHGHGEKKVETVEVDGVIQKIIVTCSCGERIEVHCGY
jgi:hypothetical protein